MISVTSFCIFFLLISCCGVNSVVGAISFSCDDVADKSEEYQCTVTGSKTNILTWRIYRDNGTQIGSDAVYVSTSNNQRSETKEGFTVEPISQSPLISNISFTAQPSINGYTIVCEDGITTEDMSCTINIHGPIPSPYSISKHVTATNIVVFWTPSNFSSQYVSGYSVLSNVTDSTITTTDTSVDISLAGLSPGVYCVSVATVDTTNRTGDYSEEECVELNVPSQPVVNISIISETSIVILWSFPESIIPPLSAVYIEYDSGPVPGAGQSLLIPLVPSNEYNYTILRDNTATVDYYNITVFGGNILGNGSTSIRVYTIFSTCTTTTATTNTVEFYIIIVIVLEIIIILAIVLVPLLIYCIKWSREKRLKSRMTISWQNRADSDKEKQSQCWNKSQCACCRRTASESYPEIEQKSDLGYTPAYQTSL